MGERVPQRKLPPVDTVVPTNGAAVPAGDGNCADFSADFEQLETQSFPLPSNDANLFTTALQTVAEPVAPVHLGRYRIGTQLGSGGFGTVYKGYDEELHREVAIKVPHSHRVATVRDADAYLAEARLLASLDHPSIVPIYDVGRTAEGGLLSRLEIHRGPRPGPAD